MECRGRLSRSPMYRTPDRIDEDPDILPEGGLRPKLLLRQSDRMGLPALHPHASPSADALSCSSFETEDVLNDFPLRIFYYAGEDLI